MLIPRDDLKLVTSSYSIHELSSKLVMRVYIYTYQVELFVLI